MQINKKIIIGITVMIVTIPLFIGVLVSVVIFPTLSISNDWIGFWGGYAGAIIGGVITLLVLRSTLKHNEQLQEAQKRQELCNHVAKLISSFSIEMIAYRSKWKFLKDEAQKAGKTNDIDRRDSIELGATKEIPRGIYFELDILLGDIGIAHDLINRVERILNDSKFNRLTVKEYEMTLNELRSSARAFIGIYIKG